MSVERSVPTRGRTLDYAAAVYDLLSPIRTLGAEWYVSLRAVDALTLRGSERVLDVGCGTGVAAFAAARKLAACGRVVGVDAAAKMIAVARGKINGDARLRFDVAAAESLPYADASFEAAVSTFFFHHLAADLKAKALGEIARVLVPGGVCAVADLDVPSSWWGKLCGEAAYRLFRQPEIQENNDGTFVKILAASEFTVQPVSRHQGYITVWRLTKK